MPSMPLKQNRIALVTGASSGIGLLTAQQLSKAGFRTFGTSRSDSCKVENVEMVVLDVCSDDSVLSCIHHVQAIAGQIDVVVNNAGVLDVSIAEEHSAAAMNALFETNFFGVVRVVNAVLPKMRERGQGKIINVSSLAGRLAPPGEALYAASKFALEGYSEALSYEVFPFGISVSLIEPGFVRTDIHKSGPRPDADFSSRFNDYEPFREDIKQFLEESIRRGIEPQKVAQLIARVACSKQSRLRYQIGRDAIWLPRLRSCLPSFIYDWGVNRLFGIGE